MITIKKVDDNDVYYDWKDWVYLDEVEDDLVILGDRKAVLFGNSTYVEVVKGDYYDDDTIQDVSDDGLFETDPEVIGYSYDTLAELKKLSGKDWQEGELKGYSQGDWCEIYYTDKVDTIMIKELETWIMGKVSEYKIEDDGDDFYNFIPHDVEWKGKKDICEYFGYDAKDCIVLDESGNEIK